MAACRAHDQEEQGSLARHFSRACRPPWQIPTNRARLPFPSPLSGRSNNFGIDAGVENLLQLVVAA